MLAKMIAFFNPKPTLRLPEMSSGVEMPICNTPRSEVRWVSTIEQPNVNQHIVVLNKYGGLSTDVRVSTYPHEFTSDAVCWCYLYEFNHLIPDFLRGGVNLSVPGVTETKAAPKYKDDAGVSYDETIVRVKELAESNRSIMHEAIVSDISAGVARPLTYTDHVVTHDWDIAFYINNLVREVNSYKKLAHHTELMQLSIRQELMKRSPEIGIPISELDALFRMGKSEWTNGLNKRSSKTKN